jgi:long-chain acyl-CoA synthetase
MHVLRARRHVVPESGRLRPGRDPGARARVGRSRCSPPRPWCAGWSTAKAAGSAATGIKTIVYGGGPMYEADIEEAVRPGSGRVSCRSTGRASARWGSPRSRAPTVADRSHPRWRERLARSARADRCEVAVGDERGGAAGRRGRRDHGARATVMPGYWQTTPRPRPRPPRRLADDRRCRRLDADGYLTLQDRSKDVIISGGTNIYPREVEEVLADPPGVHEVSVVGGRSAEWGEDVVAFVVPAPGAALMRRRSTRIASTEIARFKRPKAYFVRANCRRTTTARC